VNKLVTLAIVIVPWQLIPQDAFDIQTRKRGGCRESGRAKGCYSQDLHYYCRFAQHG
jgi:hypothetical protein